MFHLLKKNKPQNLNQEQQILVAANVMTALQCLAKSQARIEQHLGTIASSLNHIASERGE